MNKYIAVLNSGYEQKIETDLDFKKVWMDRVRCIGENRKLFTDSNNVIINLDEIAIVKNDCDRGFIPHWNLTNNTNIDSSEKASYIAKGIGEVLNKTTHGKI